MSNLPIEINHSISFLNMTIHSLMNIHNLTYQYLNSLLAIPPMKDGYSGNMKAFSNKYNKKLEDALEITINDYNIFKTEIDDIIRYKNTESVIYSSSRFLLVYDTYIKLEKKTKKMYDLCEVKKEEAKRNDNYALYIAINKISPSIYRANVICKKIISKLKILLNKDDEI